VLVRDKPIMVGCLRVMPIVTDLQTKGHTD